MKICQNMLHLGDMNQENEKFLTVIIGAGASYDCVEREIGGIANFDDDYRPPRTNELFQQRRGFSAILNKYPKVRAAAAEIRTKLATEGTSVEKLLKQLNEERGDTFKAEFREIPLYLQELLGEVSVNFLHDGSETKFTTLVRNIARFPFSHVMFLTLNYDLLLERTLERVYTHQFKYPDAYTPNEKNWSLIKIHGSANWGKNVLNKNCNKSAGDAAAVLASVGEEELELSQEIIMLSSHQDRIVRGNFYYPALAVPVEGKSDFVCPPEHVHHMQDFLGKCSSFLIIGFSALDDDLLNQLQLIKRVENLMIVNGSKKFAEEALQRLSIFHKGFWPENLTKREQAIYGGGFSLFADSSHFANFLGTSSH